MILGPKMGQKYSRLCSQPSSRGESGSRGWRRLRGDGAGVREGSDSPSSGVVFLQPPESPSGVSSVSMQGNYDDRDYGLEAPTEESWDTVQFDDGEDGGSGGESPTNKYSSIQSEMGKAPANKRKRQSKIPPPTTSASTSAQKATPPLQTNESALAGNERSQLQKDSTFRPGSLPAILADAKPMKDADRLLEVLTEHECADGLPEEGPESGDSVRRIIQHDIGRERSVNARLRELKDIETRKSERRLSVTAAATASQLHVIPEIIGEEPADPADFKYSDTNLYF
ncbi:uncharacterized protein LOC119725603 isoform X2 [Patiria miniata]|uniref:Uncharacterized protein n=1 Tax=Patiria miniata TaxID=46514 RepID=A0A913ZPM8_PATMI|nr:uncharacterized protein LOC119725603 isoform X2 [Patiria miniata]